MISRSSHNFRRRSRPYNRKEHRRARLAVIRRRLALLGCLEEYETLAAEDAGKSSFSAEDASDGTEIDMTGADEAAGLPESRLASIIEGILFAMGDSVEVERIAGALGISEEDTVKELDALAKKYERERRGIRLLKLENAYQMCTASEIYEYLIRIAKQPKKQALTDVLLETLSIIAYKQPVTKAEIEKIRGVSCDHAVSKLVEYHLVEELGRLEAPGRPMLFGTTEDFLRSFGVASLADLPTLNPVQVEEFKLQAEAEANETLSVEI